MYRRPLKSLINSLLKPFYYRIPDVRQHYYAPGYFGGFSLHWHKKVIGYYTEIQGCDTVVLHLDNEVKEMARVDAITLLRRAGNKR